MRPSGFWGHILNGDLAGVDGDFSRRALEQVVCCSIKKDAVLAGDTLLFLEHHYTGDTSGVWFHGIRGQTSNTNNYVYSTRLKHPYMSVGYGCGENVYIERVISSKI